MKLLVMACAILFAGIYLLCLFLDIVKTVYYKYKGETYNWQTTGVFCDCKSWISVLILGALLLWGLYLLSNEHVKVKTRHITTEDVYCSECENDVNESYKSFIDDNNVFFDSNDTLILDATMCDWCGNVAPSDLYDQFGNRICISCITTAINDKNVAKALNRYFEYG